LLNHKHTTTAHTIFRDTISALLVGFVLLVEVIVFSIIAGVSPIVGIYTAIIVGFIAAFGPNGQKAVISGLTGSIAIILLSLSHHVQNNAIKTIELTSSSEISFIILQYMLLATICAGMIQVLIGFLKLGKFIRTIPNYIIFGIINGLLIIMLISQAYIFKEESWVFYLLIATSLLIVFILRKYHYKLPITMIAFVVVSFIAIYFNLDTKKIADLANFDIVFTSFSIPKIIIDLDAIIMVLPYSFLIAMVGLIESLLTLNLMDEIDDKRSKDNQECMVIGASNVAAGFLGAIAGARVLGISVFNKINGGSTRLSSLLVPIFILLFVLFFYSYISMIPLAIIVAMLIITAIALFQWEANHLIYKMGAKEMLLFVTTTILTIFLDLVLAFTLCVLLSFIVYALFDYKSKTKSYLLDENTKVYEISGPLFFYTSERFLEQFNTNDDIKSVILDFKKAKVLDKAGLEAIDELVQMYEKNHTNITLKHLSAECKEQLNYGSFCCIYSEDDPRYKIALDD
jgi:SulP family sulfate permease